MRQYTLTITLPQSLFMNTTNPQNPTPVPHEAFTIYVNGHTYRFARTNLNQQLPLSYTLTVDERAFRSLMRHLLGFQYDNNGKPLYAYADLMSSFNYYVNPAVFMGGKITVTDIKEM